VPLPNPDVVNLHTAHVPTNATSGIGVPIPSEPGDAHHEKV
jgi:hypothetical protein